jgi:hypothetical protein
MVVLTVVFFRAASADDAEAQVRDAAAERQLGGIEDEPEVQPGYEVAQVRQ